MHAKTPAVPTPASPIHVVGSLASKAARREALRALHIGFAETEANIRSLLAHNQALRNTKVRRLPLFTIKAPSFAITEEPFDLGTPTSAVPPSPAPLAEGSFRPTPAMDIHDWNDLVRDEPRHAHDSP